MVPDHPRMPPKTDSAWRAGHRPVPSKPLTMPACGRCHRLEHQVKHCILVHQALSRKVTPGHNTKAHRVQRIPHVNGTAPSAELLLLHRLGMRSRAGGYRSPRVQRLRRQPRLGHGAYRLARFCAGANVLGGSERPAASILSMNLGRMPVAVKYPSTLPFWTPVCT
jgi:hypothetical protein